MNTELTLSEKVDQLAESLGAIGKSMEPIIEIAPKLKDIVEAYDSVLFGKKVLVGLASVVGSLAAIGAGVLWLLTNLRNHGS